VHGWDGTARYWDLVAPALSERYHLVAVTLRGRGRSGPDPTGRSRFADHVADLDEVTGRLGLERFVFVGASLGGMLALSFAARYPRRVERLVLGDIGAQPRGMAIVLREHFQKARDGRWRWRFGGRLRELQRTQPREVLFPTQWHVLSRIRCPVLIVRGGRSESLLPEVAERTRAALRDALLVEIPDCSHFPFLERPHELTLVLRGFLP